MVRTALDPPAASVDRPAVVNDPIPEALLAAAPVLVLHPGPEDVQVVQVVPVVRQGLVQEGRVVRHGVARDSVVDVVANARNCSLSS